ncbi:hypothetical protein PBOI14_49160 [Pseudomonas sp. Boi14]|nr:hypothetical protein PBOI14_49160 [Pseudomonas sp. Boi14]
MPEEIKLIQPAPVDRDEYGMFQHPDLPDFEEGDGEKCKAWVAQQGLQLFMISLESDALEEIADRYFQSDEPHRGYWEPGKPEGDGWFCLAIHDTDDGRWSVADPRMPEPNEKLTCVIESLDGTWHRPFTTLELAALQSLVEPEEWLELDGLSDQAWRERIGNAVPPAAAEAIAQVIGTTLLLAEAGETFLLSNMPVWVQSVAIALSVAKQQNQ